MPQRGDIVVERLTGKRAIVINVAGPDEVTCRFGDGRLEDRFVFELEHASSPLGWLGSLLNSFGRSSEPPPAVAGRVRPLVLRQPTS
jgi:hypothetical protein